MIKKTMTLALAAGAAALSLASPALADDAPDVLKPLVDSSTVTKNVVQKPNVSVDDTVAALAKATDKVNASQG
ncbi:hypothetical protein [Streptomyces sp. NPDC048606]|uniref:hypothetical protein n=1 Tax=Streptomyces sp. NPDC048606 TaxID=3154726 RepID=UPI0034401111